MNSKQMETTCVHCGKTTPFVLLMFTDEETTEIKFDFAKDGIPLAKPMKPFLEAPTTRRDGEKI